MDCKMKWIVKLSDDTLCVFLRYHTYGVHSATSIVSV